MQTSAYSSAYRLMAYIPSAVENAIDSTGLLSNKIVSIFPNIASAMQRNPAIAGTVFAIANLVAIFPAAHCIGHFFIDKKVESDTNEQTGKHIFDCATVGAVVFASNYLLTKLTQYPLSNLALLALSVAAAASRALYLWSKSEKEQKEETDLEDPQNTNTKKEENTGDDLKEKDKEKDKENTIGDTTGGKTTPPTTPIKVSPSTSRTNTPKPNSTDFTQVKTEENTPIQKDEKGNTTEDSTSLITTPIKISSPSNTNSSTTPSNLNVTSSLKTFDTENLGDLPKDSDIFSTPSNISGKDNKEEEKDVDSKKTTGENEIVDVNPGDINSPSEVLIETKEIKKAVENEPLLSVPSDSNAEVNPKETVIENSPNQVTVENILEGVSSDESGASSEESELLPPNDTSISTIQTPSNTAITGNTLEEEEVKDEKQPEPEFVEDKVILTGSFTLKAQLEEKKNDENSLEQTPLHLETTPIPQTILPTTTPVEEKKIEESTPSSTTIVKTPNKTITVKKPVNPNSTNKKNKKK